MQIVTDVQRIVIAVERRLYDYRWHKRNWIN